MNHIYRLATSAVSGANHVGGLVGLNSGSSTNSSTGTVSNAYATGSVSGTGSRLGGLVGNNAGAVSNAYATGNVAGSVSAVNSIGGLVGQNEGDTASINNAFASGNLSGFVTIGGLVGWNNAPITNAYATSNVKGSGVLPTDDTSGGGLVGLNYQGTVTNGYWNTTTAGLTTGFGSSNSGMVTGGGGKTSTEMKQQASFSGFDFTNDWFIYEGHTAPLLRNFLTPVVLTPEFNGGNQTLSSVGAYVTDVAVDASHIYRSSSDLILFSTPTAGRETAKLAGDFWSDQQGYLITVQNRTVNGTGIQLNADIKGPGMVARARGGAITQANGKSLQLSCASSFAADNGLAGAGNVRFGIYLGKAGNDSTTVNIGGTTTINGSPGPCEGHEEPAPTHLKPPRGSLQEIPAASAPSRRRRMCMPDFVSLIGLFRQRQAEAQIMTYGSIRSFSYGIRRAELAHRS